mmetsp:Transcript_2675/g.7808  ORF Transcript_2675/g.7808 Transcript_2675/m.7808 type:complete len:257 (-) Transcript_2675:367-1137(-)
MPKNSRRQMQTSTPIASSSSAVKWCGGGNCADERRTLPSPEHPPLPSPSSGVHGAPWACPLPMRPLMLLFSPRLSPSPSPPLSSRSLLPPPVRSLPPLPPPPPSSDSAPPSAGSASTGEPLRQCWGRDVPMLAPAKEASRVYEARRASSRYTTTLAVHSLAFLTEKEHEPKWKREWACLERRSGKTCCSRAEPRSAQPYMKMFFFREWPCKSTNMPSGWAACVRRRSFLKALIVGWWRTDGRNQRRLRSHAASEQR